MLSIFFYMAHEIIIFTHGSMQKTEIYIFPYGTGLMQSILTKCIISHHWGIFH